MLLVLLAVVVTVVVQARRALDGRAVWAVRVDSDSVSWSGPTDFLLATRGLLARESAEEVLSENLFPPDLVLTNEQKLGLKPEQRSVIVQEVQQFQNKVTAFQSRMPEVGTRLAETLRPNRIGENEALAQLDRVLQVERDVKKAQLAMLIRVKNVLTPEQQGILKGLR